MRYAPGFTLAATLLATVLSGCSRGVVREAAPPDCAGPAELVVRNTSGQPLNVYTGPDGKRLVATVDPGTRTVPLAAGEKGPFLFYATNAATSEQTFIGFGDRRSRGGVSYDLRCR